MNPTNCIFRDKELNESGAVLLEFSLVLPIILLIVFAGIEYIRSLQGLQFTTTISREAASVAYRDCSADLPNKINGCLDLVRQRLEAFAHSVEPGTEVILSLYEYSGGGVTKLGESLKPGAKYSSKFTTTSDSFSGPSEIISKHKRLVVAETYVPVDRIIKEILQFNFGLSEALYDATIL